MLPILPRQVSNILSVLAIHTMMSCNFRDQGFIKNLDNGQLMTMEEYERYAAHHRRSQDEDDVVEEDASGSMVRLSGESQMHNTST